jgi:hypothetical protein
MTLEQIEKEVEKTLMEEALVVLSEDFIQRLRDVYESVKEEPEA